jgi:glycosyltransferase involved in cell wall biosynthesis
LTAKQNAIFLTHKDLLHAEIDGGVQLCSQEFHNAISACDDLHLKNYFVPFTKNIFQRIQIKLGFENYSMYDVAKDAAALLKFIESENITIVFINMASCVRYAKPIKDAFGNKVKTIMLSHGNHSGDFLHLITKPLKRSNLIAKKIKKIRLGYLISTESTYRVKYLDGVIAISETEKQIENWFGAKRVVFMPRKLYADFVNYQPDLNRVGFVGRLDHPPNIQGIAILLDEITQYSHDLKLRLVGAPVEEGKKIAEKYKCVEYLGELSDIDLEKEISSWSFFINPVWWYSTGASTKLAKGISWGIPIITTTAGKRGYYWKQGELLVADSPKEMAKAIIEETISKDKINYWSNQTRIVANSGLTEDDFTTLIKSVYLES